VRKKKEIIKLDAVVVGVIKLSVYVLELRNGHRLMAFDDRQAGLQAKGMPGRRIGDRVMVAMCPGEMANGRIISSGGNGDVSG
jgi:translation initiation factor IF-1